MPKICDYEGSRYRMEFWENQNRAYEDAVERVAMRAMLPARGRRLIEVGAGFGRLVDLYAGYDQIVLMDYARTQLEEARRYLGPDPRLIFVVADIYAMPFGNHVFDALTMVRVMHHLLDAPAALSEIHRIISPAGSTVIEFANKQNLKAILRWTLGGQRWNPFDPEPVEFVELNLNFHPAWMRRQFEAVGLRITDIRTVSHFRIDLLKKLLPTGLLVRLDQGAQLTGNWWQLTPSVFVQATSAKNSHASPGSLFRCPHCRAALLAVTESAAAQEFIVTCHHCRYGWQFKDGIYDFKIPVVIP